MKPRTRSLFAALLLAGLAGCDRTGTPAASPSDAPASAPTATGPHVVLFLVDTLRADRVGAYGCPTPTTPAIDALAAEGIVFEQAYAPEGWTLPCLPSLFTSTFPCEHGIVVDWIADRTQRLTLNPALKTLAERLAALGYETVSSYANPYAGPVTGMTRGFELATKRPFTDGSHVSAWLAERSARPYFLYVHNLEPHDPWKARPADIEPFGQVPPAVVRRLHELTFQYKPLLRVDFADKQPLGTTDNTAQQDAVLAELHKILPQQRILYDAMVRLADRRVGSVIDALKAAGQWDQTLFILVSDHGEEFAEHGAYGHGHSAYEEMIRVPLIVKLPNGEHAGKRVQEVARLVDVLPTIAEVLGRPDLAAGARGESLLPFVRGERSRSADEPVVVATRINRKKYYRPWAESRGDVNVAVRIGPFKGIWNRDHDHVELFRVDQDPLDQNDVCAAHPEIAARVAAAAREFLEACMAAAVLPSTSTEGSESDETDLTALGYVGGERDEAEHEGGAAPGDAVAPRTPPAGCPVSAAP